MKRTQICKAATAMTCLTVLLAGIWGCGSNSSNGSSSFDSGFGGDSGVHDGAMGLKGNDGSTIHGNDSSSSNMDACAHTAQTAAVSPLDMYLLLDRSGSMADNNSWTEETQALSNFVYDFNSAGLGVGLQYLPLPALCDISAYTTPAVPIEILPGSAAQIVTSLSNTRPFGGTPTTVALEGAVALGKQRQVTYPDRTFVIVLSTDGVPDDSCSFVADGGLPNSTQNAIAVIAKAAAATPPIKTFVIGVGNEPALNAFAQAGGTGSAILVGAGDAGTAVDIEAPLISAFSAIRTTALPCAYSIPQASGPNAINYGDVNVTFTPSGGSPQQLYNVDKASDCQTNNSDWYYDDPANPKHVELCPNICTTVKASSSGSVDVVYGCATISAPK